MSVQNGIKLKNVQPLIPAIDVAKAASFYQESLGFKLAWTDGSSLAIVYREDVELFLSVDANPEHAKSFSIRIGVQNIESLYDGYKSKELIHPNGDLTVKPWGLKEFIIQDLNGVCIAFHETPKPKGKEAELPNKELETERLRLSPLKKEHFQSMHEIYTNPTAMAHWHTPPHASFAETETLLTDYMATSSSWVLEFKNSGKIIGLVNCFAVEDSKPTGMGYILAPEFQRKGLAKEASNGVLEHLFTTWNTPNVELWIYDDNTPSIGLAQKLGFNLESTFERSGPDGTGRKKTGIYWLRQSKWWSNKEAATAKK